MPYALDRNWSLESTTDYIVAVKAGLQSMPDLAHHVTPWTAKRDEARTLRDARDDAREVLLSAQTVVRVRDARWDGVVGKISDRAWSLAGKKATEAPYSTLFGSIPAEDAKTYGPAKATAFGKTLLAKLHELNEPELNAFADELTEANRDLELAHAARAEAEDGAALHVIRRQRFIEQLENLVAETELGIYTKRPRQKAIVSAVLSPGDIGKKASAHTSAPSEGPAAAPAPQEETK